MARSLEERLADSKQAVLSHDEFVGLLVQDEKLYRDNLRLRRLLKKAKLRQEAALEDIDYGVSRGLSQQVMLELANPQWVTAYRNVLISGPTGVGKSYIACALGNAAARAGYTVLYVRAPRLFETLQQSRGDGSHLKALARLSRVQLLIIDDFLLTSLADSERRDLLEVIEDRYQAGATIIASQCPVKDWHPNIGDPTLADAICDRLLHNAYKIELRGDSIRTKRPVTKTERKEAIESDGKLS
jgi:DNA replication protein DnaC